MLMMQISACHYYGAPILFGLLNNIHTSIYIPLSLIGHKHTNIGWMAVVIGGNVAIKTKANIEIESIDWVKIELNSVKRKLDEEKRRRRKRKRRRMEWNVVVVFGGDGDVG